MTQRNDELNARTRIFVGDPDAMFDEQPADVQAIIRREMKATHEHGTYQFGPRVNWRDRQIEAERKANEHSRD